MTTHDRVNCGGRARFIAADLSAGLPAVIAEAAVGPGGEQAHLYDGVVLARRLAGSPDEPGRRRPGQLSTSLPPATS